MRIAAAHLLGTPEWEAKVLLARHLYEDAEQHQALRTRIAELRRSEASVDTCPDPALKTLVDQLLRAESSVELLSGMYGVIKPALVEAYRRQLDEINPLVDYPTGRLLRQLLAEEAEHVELGQRYLDALFDTEQRAAAASFVDHLEAYLAAAGGLSGVGARPDTAALPPLRGDGSDWRMPERSGRDERFRSSVVKDPCVAVVERGDPAREGLEQMMWVRFHEMSPAEAVAAIMTRQTGMPWAFYRDLARHCWDEVRHASFGQAALEAEGIDIASNPNWTGFASMILEAMMPMEAYAHLTVAIEQAAMRYPPGKRQEYEFCRDTAKHELMALYQDYDWADEVNHAQFGRDWIVRHVYGGDRRAAMAGGEATVRLRLEYFSRYATDGIVPDGIARRAQQDDSQGSTAGY
jgi:uncharacterized ferritin-like protein (DUF455 family)